MFSLVAAGALMACSGNDPANPGASAAVAVSKATPPVTAPPTTVVDAAPILTSTTTAPTPTPHVEVDVEIGPTATMLAADAAVTDSPVDPFGPYASCSGLRDSVGNWSLQISDPADDMTSLSIFTGPGVTGAGAFDGTFRVEFINGVAIDATGTVTLDASFQSGSFEALDADLRGTFECAGAAQPEPLGTGSVQVFALLQRGVAQRIMSLTEPVDDCEDGVEVTGDAGVGAPVSFQVDPPAVSISMGDAPFPLNPTATQVSVAGRAGTFHAETNDGLVIDGAYSCS